MHTSSRRRFGSVTLSLAAVALASSALPAAATTYDVDGLQSGMVFTSSNAATGNELLIYARGADGALSFHAKAPTGGAGSGAGLGSQGAVTLSGDGRFVFVVNAGNNTVSTFALRGRELRLVSVVDSGGLHPISVAEHNGLVYVLNDGGEGNVAGLRNVGGTLQPIAGSARGLSAAGGVAPAQVGFSDDGDALVITEKGTNLITSYRVNAGGLLSGKVVTPSPGLTPFGFAFNGRNRLVVSEAAGGAAGASTVSSYRFTQAAPAQPVVASAAVPDLQGAACWVAITTNGRYAYIANTGSSSMSSYRIEPSGTIALIESVAGATGAGTAPADTAVSADGRHLYVRNGGVSSITAFKIGPDGTLGDAALTALPGPAVGLAAN